MSEETSTTSQPFTPAKISNRIAAYIVDMLIIFGLGYTLFGMLTYNSGQPGYETGLYNVASSVLWIALLLYFPLFHLTSWRATPGKRLLHMKLVSESGKDITVAQVALRFAASYISYKYFFRAGDLLALKMKNHQTLHDLVAKTVVVEDTLPKK